jgi:putative sigma-54 modulation protein
MNLTIRSHHTTVFADFNEHATRKLERLERLLPRIGDVVVEVEYEETRSASHRYAVQVTLHTGPSILRAEERGADPQIALDLATDVLSRQARRHKKRLHDRHHPHGAKEAVAAAVNTVPRSTGEPATPDEEDEYVLGNIVRVKHFETAPMSHEDALIQMDLLGHDLFLFLDADTNEYAVIYKRKDGEFGLLSPRRV